MSKEYLKKEPGELSYPLHVLYSHLNMLKKEYERLTTIAKNIEWKDNEIRKAMNLIKERMKELETAIFLFEEFNYPVN